MKDEELEGIVKQYAGLIHSAMARVAGGSAGRIRDDVEQNVLISLWKAMKDEQTPSHPSSYIYRAAVRETIRAVRGLRQTVELPSEVEQVDGAATPEALTEANELGRAICEALLEIGADRRRAVRAHLIGYDVKEIMLMFDWPYDKARNLITRGRADLRRKLSTRGYHD